MKSLTKRNIALVVLSVIVALCSLTFAATVKPARATEDGTYNITVIEAAQVRVGLNDNDNSGIRFRVTMNGATKDKILADNVQLGFIITPYEYFKSAYAQYENDNTYDFLSQMKKNNAESFEEGKRHAYVGTQGVGILMAEDQEETKIYADTKVEDVYYANAAVENIKEANRELPFTMLAYLRDNNGTLNNYEDDNVIQYFLPSDPTFAREYLKTAHKSFVAGDVSLEVISQAKDTAISTIGTAKNPAQVVDSADLYNMSKAVSNGVTYSLETEEGETKNAVFELVNNVEVDYDFVQIPTTFAGVFNDSDKVISIVNNKGLESVFVNKDVNVECENNTKLFNASTRAGKLVMPYDRDAKNVIVNGYNSNEEIAKTITDLVNPVGYSDDAVSVSVIGDNIAAVVLQPNFSKSDLEEMEEINSVRFSYMTSAKMVSKNKIKPSNFETSLFGLSGYDAAEKRDIAATYVASNAPTPKQWRTVTVTKKEFLQAYTENGMLAVYCRNAETQTSGDIYIGDIELLEEITLYPSYKKVRDVLTSYTPVIKDAEGGVVSEDTASVLYEPPKFSVQKPEAIETSHYAENGIGGELPKHLLNNFAFPMLASADSGGTARLAFKDKALYAKLNYNKEEILAFAGTPTIENNEVKYSNFNGIAITYCVDSVDGKGLPELYRGALPFGAENANKWITQYYSIDDFITKYLGCNSFELEGNTYSTADLITTDDYVFLGYVGHEPIKANRVRLYVAGIEFVKELPAAQ
ncbi:MAG: hypothetical protein E7340_06710 [Clostridiales bacterium]|nr:hypothetical protein [Clostridiales bacterium]